MQLPKKNNSETDDRLPIIQILTPLSYKIRIQYSINKDVSSLIELDPTQN